MADDLKYTGADSVDREVYNLRRRVDALERPYTQITLTYQNGWAQYSAAIPVVARKYANGNVELLGLLNPAAKSADTCFTLPVGYRPRYDYIYPIGDSTNPTVVNMLYVNSSTGGVSIVNSATPTYYSLCGARFLGER